MAETSKTEMMIKEETKELSAICERLVGAVKHEVEKGIENVDATELGEVIDMIKDLSEAKEKVIKGCYYKTLMEAMEEAEYGEDYDEDGPMGLGRRGYRGQKRDSRGRYMSRRGYEEMIPDYDRMEHMRDMDREHMHRMYYSDNGTMHTNHERDHREGRSGMMRRSYMETKELHKGNAAEDKQKKMKALEDYMAELSSDVTEMINGATPEEKNILRTKMQTLAQKIV